MNSHKTCHVTSSCVSEFTELARYKSYYYYYYYYYYHYYYYYYYYYYY